MGPDEGASKPPGDVTRLLLAWRQGDAAAPRELFALVYDELARAGALPVAPGPRRVSSATGLVHEAYLKLVEHSRLDVRDRGYFFALASRAMRQVLIDRARRRVADKRGGSSPAAMLDEGAVSADARIEDLLALDEALSRLEGLDPRLARLVEARFFAGLSVEETAEALEISPRTVKRDWNKARALLHRDLRGPSAR